MLPLFIPSVGYAEFRDVLSKFTPYFSFQEEYSDNINLAPSNKKDDFITSVSPGVRFSHTGVDAKSGIDLDYLLGLVFYAKNSQDNYVRHTGTLNTWYTLNPRLSFRLRDYFIRSEEPVEQEYIAGALSNQFLLGSERQRAIYIRNIFEPSVDYQFGAEDHLSLRYLNNIYQNQSQLFENSREDFVSPRLVYWFNVRNGVSLEYGLSFGDFKKSPDFVGHSIEGRYTYRFNPQTSIFGDFIYLMRDFKFPGIDYDVYTPSIGFLHSFSPTLSGSFQLGYFWENAEDGSATNGYSGDVNLTQRAEKTTYSLSLKSGYTEDYFTAENLGFTKTYGVIGTVTRQLQEKTTLGFSGTLERAEYKSGRKDWLWGIWGNVSYQPLRWLTAYLEIFHREDNSNLGTLSYQENRGMVRITAGY